MCAPRAPAPARYAPPHRPRHRRAYGSRRDVVRILAVSLGSHLRSVIAIAIALRQARRIENARARRTDDDKRRRKARALLVAKRQHVDAKRQRPRPLRAMCRAARMPATTPKIPSYRPASITVSMCEPISRRRLPARQTRCPRTVPSASSFTSSPASRIHARD